MAAFERLSALDAVFLAIEDERNLMHVALTAVFEKGPLRTESGALDTKKLRAHGLAALQSLPRFRRRLTRVPLVHHPVLVDDPSFDLDAHLRFLCLEHGDDAELKELVGRIYTERLDRSRPLWEMWAIDGLHGDRFALVTKAHHCLVDGVAGIAALAAMLNAFPQETPLELHEQPLETPPSPGELAREEVKRLGTAGRDAIRKGVSQFRAAPDALAFLRGAGSRIGAFARGLRYLVANALPPATRTSFNPSQVGGIRRAEWLETDLAVVRPIREAASVKLNDVALAVVAGAMRRFLQRRGESTEGLDFRVLVPVSTHAGEGDLKSNRVSVLVVPLPLGEGDPKERLLATARTVRAAKASGEADAVTTAERVADFTFLNLATLAVKIAIRCRPYNVVVTNVPGPGIPLYLLGARLLAVYPMVPLYLNNAIGIALVSYAGKLFWGLNADASLVADLPELAKDLTDSVDELARAMPAPA